MKFRYCQVHKMKNSDFVAITSNGDELATGTTQLDVFETLGADGWEMCGQEILLRTPSGISISADTIHFFKKQVEVT